MDAPEQQSSDAINGDFTRYRAPQNVAAISGAVVIKDDRGIAAFEIDGGAQATDDVIQVRDLAGTDFCLIRGSALLLGDSIEIVGMDGAIRAVITRVELSAVRERFSVQVGPETTWTVEGLVAEYEYRIRDRTGEIAEVSRRWFRARDSYGIEVAAGQRNLLVLSVAVCLDLLMHSGR